MVGDNLDVDSIWNDLSIFLKLGKFILCELSESELSADSDGLSAWELEHGSSECFLGMGDVVHIASDGQQDGSNVDSGCFTERLSESTSHTLLKSIGSSARKHLVDSENVPWVNSHSHVESVFTCFVLHVLVASNTSSFQSF